MCRIVEIVSESKTVSAMAKLLREPSRLLTGKTRLKVASGDFRTRFFD